MAPYPRESNSSGATGALIAAVVIGVLLVGLLAMVVLGLLFYFYAREGRVIVETERDVVPMVEALPGDVPPTIGDPLDQQPVVTEPELSPSPQTPDEAPPTVDAAVSPEASPSPDEVRRSDSPDLPAPESTAPARKQLAELTPLEVLDIRLDDTDLVRSAHVAGQSCPSAIWAQPVENLGTCQVSYLLRKAYQRLTGAAAVADAVGERTEVPAGTFRIYGDGNLLWDSGTLQGYGSSKQFDVAVEGLHQVVLVVESDSPSDVSLFAWVDPQLVVDPSLKSP